MLTLAEALGVYAAVVSTVLGVVKLNEWSRQRRGGQLRVMPRMHPLYPKQVSHLEVDFQATAHPTSVQAVYFAGYSNRLTWLLRSQGEVVGTDVSKVLPRDVKPGHGFEALIPVTDKERALAIRCRHVRLIVRFTGLGQIVSSPVTTHLLR
jgi:hypothetical protein